MASNLEAIRAKVRRLTRSPAEAQLPVADIDEYVNTFVLYDLPESLRLFTLRENFTFYAQPYVGAYATNETNADDPLYNMKNIYTTFHEPAYCDGYKMYFSQSQEEFRNVYPEPLTITRVGGGDGVTVAFGGTLANIPIVPGSILVESIAADESPMSLFDQQILDPVTGIPSDLGNLIETNSPNPVGVISYITGEYNFTFTTAPGDGEDVNIHLRSFQPSRPTSIFYFNNTLHLRPIPDQPYKITIEAYKRPTQLLVGESPELEQWWQYIAYGAAIKVFQDRTDEEGVRMLMPEFKNQERLVLRRTIVQQTNERVSTIYTEQIGTRGVPGWWNR